MRFGGDWTPQSFSDNMTGCLGYGSIPVVYPSEDTCSGKYAGVDQGCVHTPSLTHHLNVTVSLCSPQEKFWTNLQFLSPTSGYELRNSSCNLMPLAGMFFRCHMFGVTSSNLKTSQGRSIHRGRRFKGLLQVHGCRIASRLRYSHSLKRAVATPWWLWGVNLSH